MVIKRTKWPVKATTNPVLPALALHPRNCHCPACEYGLFMPPPANPVQTPARPIRTPRPMPPPVKDVKKLPPTTRVVVTITEALLENGKMILGTVPHGSTTLSACMVAKDVEKWVKDWKKANRIHAVAFRVDLPAMPR